MRCEPWMNKTPIPRYTPLELAERDRDFWLSRVSALNDELHRAETNVAEALATFAKLKAAR
jgi:hypothetical protein